MFALNFMLEVCRRLRVSELTTGLALIGVCGVFGQDSGSKQVQRPRFSDVQDSIHAAKTNALRARTEGNREDFLSILGDVEAALDSARQDSGRKEKQAILDKIHSIQPEVRKALIDAGRHQSGAVKKIKSVTINQSEAQAKDKGIVEKMDPVVKPKRNYLRKVNPLRWIGRSRQYTKVVERTPAPKPDSWRSKKEEPKMVWVPPMPFEKKSELILDAPPVSKTPATLVAKPAMATPGKPVPESSTRRKISSQHQFIPEEQRAATRRISELTRDGQKRLPRGRIDPDAKPSPLTRKIKKPERKSTKVWSLGPKDQATRYIPPPPPPVKWNSPSRPQQILPTEPLGELEIPRIPKEVAGLKTESLQRPSGPRIPSRRIPSRPGFSRPNISAPHPSSNESRLAIPFLNLPLVKASPAKRIHPFKKPRLKPDSPKGSAVSAAVVLNTRSEAKAQPPAGRVEKLESAKGSGVSSLVVANTRSEAKAQPPSGKIEKLESAKGSSVSSLVVADTREKPRVRPAESKPIEVVTSPDAPPAVEKLPTRSSPESAVLEEASSITREMKKEEARLNEQLNGIDKILSQNSDVLSEAEALLKELEELQKEEAAAAKKKPASVNRPTIRRPTLRKHLPPKPKPAEVKPSIPQEVENETDAKQKEETVPGSLSVPVKKNWGTTIRRPGVRR